MRWLKIHPILLISLLLLMAFVLFLLSDKEQNPLTKREAVGTEAFPPAGFADYDLLPGPLKKRMEELVKNDTNHQYSFYYFFKTDDINHHYYLHDRGLEVVAEMPVTNEKTLDLVEEKLNKMEVKRLGRYVAYDTNSRQKHRQDSKVVSVPKYKSFIFYVLPEGKADFSQLRVGIMKDTVKRALSTYPVDTMMYDLEEVDVPPQPVRGLDYFQEAVRKEAQLDVVLALFDTGTVTVEFYVVGKLVQALDVVQGFNNRHNSYEAYQADSEFMKAVHNAKVLWKPGIKNGQPVKTKMKITFKIDAAKVSAAVHQLPSR